MSRYQWARGGDINAFFGLMLDNAAVMVILVSTLSRPGQFTTDFVLTHMIPGTALGVLIGDLVYTWMAFRLARQTGNTAVTAMPLGLDTPSTFGVAFLILLPALDHGKQLYGDHNQAMEFAWHVGLVVLVLCGIFKVLCAAFGNLVRRLVPRAGLLGSLAAIALTLIAFLPMLLHGIADVPLVGMVALTVILITLVAHLQLPFRFPGALAAVLLGVILYQLFLLLGQQLHWPMVPPLVKKGASAGTLNAFLSLYHSQPDGWWTEVFETALFKLPLALPFALATIVGGIDCTESAAAAGDTYDTRAILLTEGLASLIAGLLGGVIQTTPYIGHPAYKKMGGRAAYTLATALFVGGAGYFGWFAVLFDYLPEAAMFPILVFVGLEITAQTFHATEPKHYPALALAMLPALAYLIKTAINAMYQGALPGSPEGLHVMQTMRCLANGFLITGMLWAAAMAQMLDGKLARSAFYLLIAAVFAFFGIIHSPLPDEKIGLPWHVLAEVPPQFTEAVRYQGPWHWSTAYGLMALLLMGLDLSGKGQTIARSTNEDAPLHPEQAGRESPYPA